MADERFYVLVGVGVALAALALFTVSQVFSPTSTRDGQLCILAELEEHRVNSYSAHRDTAVADGRPFNVPQPPPKIDQTVKGACERFMNK